MFVKCIMLARWQSWPILNHELMGSMIQSHPIYFSLHPLNAIPHWPEPYPCNAFL